MKKLLGIFILSLLVCSASFADKLRVVDGDTIVLNGEKIRFSGIDTPELKQTCMPVSYTHLTLPTILLV